MIIIEGTMVFNATFNNISVISLTNFITLLCYIEYTLPERGWNSQLYSSDRL
jgi:hypothetical protein